MSLNVHTYIHRHTKEEIWALARVCKACMYVYMHVCKAKRRTHLPGLTGVIIGAISPFFPAIACAAPPFVGVGIVTPGSGVYTVCLMVLVICMYVCMYALCMCICIYSDCRIRCVYGLFDGVCHLYVCMYVYNVYIYIYIYISKHIHIHANIEDVGM